MISQGFSQKASSVSARVSVAPNFFLYRQATGNVASWWTREHATFLEFFRNVKLFGILKNCELRSIRILVYFTEARPPPAKSSQTLGRRQ